MLKIAILTDGSLLSTFGCELWLWDWGLTQACVRGRTAGLMGISAAISPNGKWVVADSEVESDAAAYPPLSAASASRVVEAFAAGEALGMFHLATAELGSTLPPELAFARAISQLYLTRLCHTPELDAERKWTPIPAHEEDVDALLSQAPPMRGLEYLAADVIREWWRELDGHVAARVAESKGGIQEFLREKNPQWRTVGRVTFHLAENKRDPAYPFAFMATYAHRLSSKGTAQHMALSQALREYAGEKHRSALLNLLVPIDSAARQVPWVQKVVESGEIYSPLAWTPRQAHAFLTSIPLLESNGLMVRVPDWWKASKSRRPTVSVTIGNVAKSKLGPDALLDFNVGVCWDGDPLDEDELRELISSGTGLVQLRGQWVEVDRDKLTAALSHWKQVEREARNGEISFFEGMRLLSGADVQSGEDTAAMREVREWTGLSPGKWLDETLGELRDPAHLEGKPPAELRAELRPYQVVGVNWLRFMTRLGLGACLADDMGLGKTIQMIALLLHLKQKRDGDDYRPSLLVVPASLIANWKSELAKFAPSLSAAVVHPSERTQSGPAEWARFDLVITTYGTLSRQEALRAQRWQTVILDEAQAIKNSGTRQARVAKELQASSRVALTGTPVENRLSDLWSLFDFLNPGLLGTAKAFARYCKSLQSDSGQSFAPLRTLVKPYILRRLKTDKRIISDLPDKTEMKAFCGLTRRQAVMYKQSVEELERQITQAEGIQRRGIVLAFLLRFKQICNHPAQWIGDANYQPEESGKFHRLGQLAEEFAARQEKVLVFTQFREIVDPLAEYLATIFQRPGLTLHGGTAIPHRKQRVNAFQRDDGPPFFVLSIKAGGTGLNLTAASQVVHFDRWWNPAVENQATDRAFRIGQKRNVVVHKFICRGTVEEKIDALITEKVALSNDLLDAGAERMLTEMSNSELMDFVSLDISKSAEE